MSASRSTRRAPSATSAPASARRLGEGDAEAAGGAGDDGDLAVEAEHVVDSHGAKVYPPRTSVRQVVDTSDYARVAGSVAWWAYGRWVRTDLDLTSHGDPLSAWHYRAGSDAWTTPAGPPVRGDGARLRRHQGRRADAVRREVRRGRRRRRRLRLPRLRHLRAARRARTSTTAATATTTAASSSRCARCDGIDPDRVVLWGSSYSGGHVVAVAGRRPPGRRGDLPGRGDGRTRRGRRDRQVRRGRAAAAPHRRTRCAVSCSAATRSRSSRRPASWPRSPRTTGCRATRSSWARRSSTRCSARGILPILVNRPVASASRLTMPLMLVVAAADTIAPPSAVERVAAQGRRTGRGRALRRRPLRDLRRRGLREVGRRPGRVPRLGARLGAWPPRWRRSGQPGRMPWRLRRPCSNALV